MKTRIGVIVCLVALTVSACGTSGNESTERGGDPAATSSASETPSSSASASPSAIVITPEVDVEETDPPLTGRNPGAVSGGPAATWLLEERDLPQGWRPATGQQHLGIPQICDVVLEPPALASAATRRYTRGWEGPFVIQYSFDSSDEAATAAQMEKWVSAASSCTTSQVEGSPVSVEPLEGLTPRGTDFAAVRVTAASPGAGTRGTSRDYVAFRNGTRVTVLLSYSISDLAPVTVLDDIAGRIAAQPE